MRVLYIVWWEGALENPLIHRQVGQLVRELHALEGVEMQLLIADAFWKVRLRDKMRGTQTALDLERLRRELPGVNIHIRHTPVFPRASRWHTSGWVLKALAFGHRRWLRRLCRREDIDLLHCRSYPATIMAQRAETGLPVLMDTRGNYPEEGVVTGSFADGSPEYQAWKRLESELYANAAGIVSVTQMASAYIRDSGVETPTFSVPTSTDLAPFANLTEGPRRGLVYIGAMGLQSLINAQSLLDLYTGMRPHLPEPRLRIITRSNHEVLRAFFAAADIHEPELELTTAYSPAESARLLHEGLFAALPFSLPPDAGPSRTLIGRHILAVKTGEYHAAGLPILVSEEIGGASEVVRAHGSGVVVGASTDWADTMANLLENYDSYRAAALAGADFFNVSKHAASYRDIYRQLQATFGEAKSK